MGKDYTWDNIFQFDENKWYYEDRLNDPAWFKACLELSIGSGGHPCEHYACHVYPVNYDTNRWYFLLDDRYSITYFGFPDTDGSLLPTNSLILQPSSINHTAILLKCLLEQNKQNENTYLRFSESEQALCQRTINSRNY